MDGSQEKTLKIVGESKRVLQVAREIETLGNKIDWLVDKIKFLENRLEPISNKVESLKNIKEEVVVSPLVPVAELIKLARQRIKNLADNVEEIINNLEI